MTNGQNVAGAQATAPNADKAPVAPAAPKVKRRGVASATGVQRLTFDHRDAQPNGLFLAHIESVEVAEVDFSTEQSGVPSFAGLKVPVVNVNFASNDADPARRKYTRLRLMAAESTAATIPGGKEAWKVDVIFNWMKHLLDVFYLKGRAFTDEEADKLALPYDDTDENGDYLAIAPETVVAGWKVVFENFAHFMNAGLDGTPVYMANGKPIQLWIKLLRYTKNGNKGWQEINRGNLVFPTFVGQGCVEIYKQNTVPVIKIDVTREDIRPREIKKDAKAPNAQMPGMPGMPGGVNISMGAPMAPMGSEMNYGAGMGLDDDLPEF